MKLKKSILFILLVIFLASCRKGNVVPNEFPELEGEYVWTHSNIDAGIQYTPQSTEKEFRLKITNKDRVILYEGNKKKFKFNFDYAYQQSTYEPIGIILEDKDENLFYLFYYAGEVSISRFPFDIGDNPPPSVSYSNNYFEKQ